MAKLPQGFEIWDGDKIRCCDCQHWEYVGAIAKGKEIVHNRVKCNTPKLQMSVAKVSDRNDSLAALRAKVEATQGNGMETDELLAAVERGYLTVSQAMNTDF